MDYYTLSRLIQRYRAGTATDEEQYLLENFWRAAQEDTSYLDSLAPEERQLLKVRMFAETRQRILQQQRPARRFAMSMVYRAAAAFALVAVATALLIYWSGHRINTIHTLPGEHICLTLPDSSHVTLNGNSTLRYAANWNRKGTREVWIEGEAFFSVQHTQGHDKFIVHMPQSLDVEVLGTKFNVRSRAQRSEVMLAEGKVKLAMTNSIEAPVYLKPGELATATGKTLSKRVVEQKEYTSWVTNTLVFKRTRLAEVAALLRDTYGLQVSFSDSTLAQRELSGEIGSAHADDILSAISETFNLQVTRSGNDVTIAPRETQQPSNL